MTPTRSTLGLLLLTVLVVTAGCSGGAGGAGGGDAGREAATGVKYAGSGGGDGGQAASFDATATPMAERTPVAREEDAGGSRQVYQARARILTGHVELEVDDFGAARANLTAAAERHGGFVSDASRRLHRVDNETYTTGVVVLRVPSENFSALVTRVEAEGTVLRTEQNSRDVTDQLIDLEARLSNLRAERDRLRELYRGANDTSEILQVQNRLSDVQGEIERIEARKQALERRVALSTITVELEEPRPEPDPIGPDEWYDVGVLAAFLQSVSGVVTAIRAIVVAVAYALPYLIVFGTPLAAAAVVVHRRRSDRLFRR